MQKITLIKFIKIIFIIICLLLIFTITDLYIRSRPQTHYNNYSEFLNEWRSPNVFPSQLPASAENIRYKYDKINDFKCISFTLNEKDFNEYYSEKYIVSESEKETFELCVKPYITDYEKLNSDSYYFNTFEIKERSISGIIVINNNNVMIFHIKI